MDNSYILLQENDSEYEPTEEEVREEARFLGIAPSDEHLLWIAKEALRAPLPKNWEPYQHKKTGVIVYYNTKTGETSENHPLDDYFRSLYMKLKTTPLPVESFSMRDMSGAENVTESHPPNFQPKDSVGIINSAEFQLSHSLSFLNSYDRREAESLQNEIQKLTVEITLFNEF
ncbi:uncharacterized protein [Blastocystis hominis]|uniref:WW domain-containing protein n=1 Tax=Blastocystis hominis TaxID=12968 RepID=D8LX35_BLAHO|nr:uncharacterized protein [Blastocystis hominis]CBK20830.2 unnamed protein product [Blastocystis hominis]|eukprot:XP_012894878.1 uncharacterized protein [Blastocystis hominis]